MEDCRCGRCGQLLWKIAGVVAVVGAVAVGHFFGHGLGPWPWAMAMDALIYVNMNR